MAAALTAYFILGLACVHGLVVNSATRTPILFGVYTLLVILPFAVPVVLVLGLVEQVAGLRKRFGGVDPTPS